MKIEEGGIKDSTGSNLKFDNALFRADAYSPGSRELWCESADTTRIILYRAAGASVWSCVLFAIVQQLNFVTISKSVIAAYRYHDL